MWEGKGRGKTGRRCKKKVPVKKTTKTVGQEGWQDPDVLRALRGEAPSGVRRALDDACKRKYSGRMIHSTKRGVQSGLKGQPRNLAIQAALTAAAKATTAKTEIKKHGPHDKLRWMKEIKL